MAGEGICILTQMWKPVNAVVANHLAPHRIFVSTAQNIFIFRRIKLYFLILITVEGVGRLPLMEIIVRTPVYTAQVVTFSFRQVMSAIVIVALRRNHFQVVPFILKVYCVIVST